MNGFISKLEKHVVPVAAKFGSQRHLVAVRDGFAVLMPLVIVASFAVLINQLPIPQFQAEMSAVFGEGWKNVGGNIYWGTLSMISVFLAFAIGYQLTKSYNGDGLAGGLIALSSFAIFIPQSAYLVAEKSKEAVSGWGFFNANYTSSTGMFVALVVAILSTEVFVKLTKSKKLLITMPEGVPPAVARSFATLLPAMLTLVVFGLISVFANLAIAGLTSDAANQNVFYVLNTFFTAPVQKMTNTMGSALIIVFLNHFLWFFGLHGSNIIGSVIEPIMLPLLIANQTAVAAGHQAQYIVTKPFFDAFIYLGGSGTTISLLIAVFIAGKRKTANREIAKLGFAPGLFNINEPVIFGMPLVLNVWYFIPFIFGPMVITVISFLAIQAHLVPMTTVMIPWTTPPILGGILATNSIAGGLLAAFNLLLSVAMYMPFIILQERMEAKAIKQEQFEEENSKAAQA